VKLLGAGYLIWLGDQHAARRRLHVRAAGARTGRRSRTFRQACRVGAEPKVAVFFLSLFPQFINPPCRSVFGQSVVLGALHALVSLFFNSILVTIAAMLSAWLCAARLVRAQRWFSAGHLVARVWLALTPARACDERTDTQLRVDAAGDGGGVRTLRSSMPQPSRIARAILEDSTATIRCFVTSPQAKSRFEHGDCTACTTRRASGSTSTTSACWRR